MPGKFSFSAPIPLGYSEKMSDKFVSITDLDGDNKNELVLLKTRQLVIFKNNSISGQIQLEELTSFDLAQSVFAYGLNIGDLDGDTRPEMVINIHSPDKTLVFRNTSKSGVISFDKEMILS